MYVVCALEMVSTDRTFSSQTALAQINFHTLQIFFVLFSECIFSGTTHFIDIDAPIPALSTVPGSVFQSRTSIIEEKSVLSSYNESLLPTLRCTLALRS